MSLLLALKVFKPVHVPSLLRTGRKEGALAELVSISKEGGQETPDLPSSLEMLPRSCHALSPGLTGAQNK